MASTQAARQPNVIRDLANQRRLRKLSQREVDRKLGLSAGLTQKWEAGKRHPQFHHLMAYARLVHCTIEANPNYRRAPQ